MKDYINRYIYAVTRRLPIAARDEVEAELRAHISDMLSDQPDETEIDDVLHTLGHPRKIASNYDERKRYVVAPEFYADYQLALKIGLVAIGTFALFFTALNALLSVDQETVWGAIGYVFENILNGTFNAVVFAFAFITIGFWIASSEKVREKMKPWQLKDLMEVPNDHKTTAYKHGKAIVALVFQVIASTVFIVILLYYLERFGIYDQGVLVAPLFGMSMIRPYIPFVITAQILTVGAQALLVMQRKYSAPMLLVYTIGTVLSATLTLIIIRSNGFITDSFISIAAQNAGMVRANLVNTVNIVVTVLTVLIIIGTIGDLVAQWKKLFKPLKQKEK